jgi:hypothetical protein
MPAFSQHTLGLRTRVIVPNAPDLAGSSSPYRRLARPRLALTDEPAPVRQRLIAQAPYVHGMPAALSPAPRSALPSARRRRPRTGASRRLLRCRFAICPRPPPSPPPRHPRSPMCRTHAQDARTLGLDAGLLDLDESDGDGDGDGERQDPSRESHGSRRAWVAVT